MYVPTRSSCCWSPNRKAAGPLLAMAAILAGATIVAGLMDSAFDATLVLVVATVLGGMLVNGRARVPGTPMIAAWIMVPAIVLTGLMDPGGGPGGSAFMALLLAVLSASRSVAVLVSIILASAEVVSRLI